MYDGLSAPTAVVPLYHWYEGVVPPLTGVAVKVTEVPAQTGLAEGEIEILTGNNGLTAMMTTLDVAGTGDGHATLEISLQLMLSRFDGV